MRHARAGQVTIASYNIHKCVGSDGRFDPERTAEVIAEIGADVLAIQEADRRFGDRAGLLDLAAIARATGLEAVPVRNSAGGHGWRGNLLLVRSGRARSVRQLVLPGHEPRGALVADLELSAGPLRVIAAHLALLRSARRRQVARLQEAAHADAGTWPVVLLGDLNEWRRSALHGLAPEFEVESLRVPSFPAGFPVLALDRIFARPHGVVSGFAVHDTPLARRASDHLPVKARLNLATGTVAAPKAFAEATEERLSS